MREYRGRREAGGPMTIKQELQFTKQKGLHSSTANGENSKIAKPRIGGRLRAIIQSMRPRQWTKNLALFIGLIFAQQLFTLTSFERAFVAFVVFCLASSCIYIFNDLLDLERDRQHPTKSKRPLASGDLSVSWAIVTIGILLLSCIGLTLLIFKLPIRQTYLFASLGGANVLFALTV